MTNLVSSVRRALLLCAALLYAPTMLHAQSADFAHFDVATDGDTIHLLSGQGKKGAAEIALFHRLSKDGGTWSKPRRLGSEDAKNADLAVAADASLVAVWDDRSGAGSPLRMARSRDAGANWSAVETIAANRDATHPRVVATSRGTLTLWFEGQPWSGAKLMANGRPIESATP